MNMWYWEYVKPGLMVEAAKVDTHAQLARPFMDKQYWHTIGQYTRTYPALFQHFINVLLHDIEFVCTKSVLLMVWWWCIFINKVNGMIKCMM